MENKINWLEWGKEAFERAKKEGKPILLDISAVWCHWCHQMSNNTYSNDVIAKIINESFIPVRVDTDRRPDVNERYNQGGWPTTAFLTPEGELIAGATYVPPEHMKTLLPQVKYFYEANKGNIKTTIHRREYTEGEIRAETADVIVGYLKENFDAQNGGFYYEPKFPMPEALELLMLEYRKTKDKKTLEIIEKTLDGMTGIYDKIEGGFFRYSVTADWSLPHYEKMLEVNAGLLQNYLHGFALTGKEEYKRTALGIINYIRKRLFGEAFYGSQDADEEYYKMYAEQRKKAQEPFIDQTIYTSWNAKCIISFIDAYAVLDDESLLLEAEKALGFLLENCYDQKKGMCHYYDGKPGIYGLLADNAWAMLALTRMHQATANIEYLETAEKIAAYSNKNLSDGKGFFDRTDEESMGMLRERTKPITENSIAAMAFAELAKLTGKEEHKKTAEKYLSIFSQDYRTYGVHSAIYALAAEKLLDGIHVVAVGTEEDRKEMRKLLALPDARITAQFLDTGKDKKRIEKLGYGPGVFICRGSTCSRAADIEEAVKKLGDGN